MLEVSSRSYSHETAGCYSIDANTVSEGTVSALLEEQWFSVGGDGREALYSATCADSAEFVSSLPDMARWAFAEVHGLPRASPGMCLPKTSPR
jgi:hypothetical protein